MELFILMLLGWGGYKLFKLNTAAGAEALRAYIYLEMLLEGANEAQAAAIVSKDMIDLDTNVMRHIINEIATVHGGRSNSLIAEAYKHGMPRKMPSWYPWYVSRNGTSYSVEVIYMFPLMEREMHRRHAAAQSRKTSARKPEPMTQSVHAPNSGEVATYEEFYKILVSESRRLAGRGEDAIHPVEMVEQDPFKRAFFDGISPRDLAQMWHDRYSRPIQRR